MNDNGISDIDRMKIIYEATEMIRNFISPYFPCQKGCSYCCSIDVSITTIEAEYISLNTNVKMHYDKPLTFNHYTPCPFLEDGKCSVYEYRPFICRIYHVMSGPVDCKNRNNAIQYGTSASGYGNVIFKQFVEWISMMNKKGVVKDIRDFFGKSDK